MKEAGALAIIGKTGKSVASLAEGTATRIPGSGGLGKQLAAPRKLNKARVGAAAAVGAAALGAGAAALANRNQEKRAAVGMLIEAGIDFDTAVNLVEKKAAELA